MNQLMITFGILVSSIIGKLAIPDKKKKTDLVPLEEKKQEKRRQVWFLYEKIKKFFYFIIAVRAFLNSCEILSV